jgi:hypothetical protein
LRVRAAGAPMKAANSSSKRLTLGPVVIQSDLRASMTSPISSAPIRGGEKREKGATHLYLPLFHFLSVKPARLFEVNNSIKS